MLFASVVYYTFAKEQRMKEKKRKENTTEEKVFI